MKRETEGKMIGAWIKGELDARKMPYRMVARMCGITHQRLANLLGGEVGDPGIFAIRRLMAVLGCTLADVEQRLPKVELGDGSTGATLGRPKTSRRKK